MKRCISCKQEIIGFGERRLEGFHIDIPPKSFGTSTDFILWDQDRREEIRGAAYPYWAEGEDGCFWHLTLRRGFKNGRILLRIGEVFTSYLKHPWDVAHCTHQTLTNGSYSRLLRFCCVFISLLLLPAFLLLGSYFPAMADNLSLFPIEHPGCGRLLLYILFAELALDLFQYSAAHSPSSYSGALSIVGGLILSDAAIDLHWVSLEVMFYAAATMLASLALSSTAFSEGLRCYRIFLLLMTGFLGLWGFISGCILVLLSILTTPSFAGKSFFWPLYPFNREALSTLLRRKPTYMAQPGHVWKRERKK